MVALSDIFIVVIHCVKAPFLNKFAVYKIVCCNNCSAACFTLRTCVITSCKNHAWSCAVKICNGGKVSFGTVSECIAPRAYIPFLTACGFACDLRVIVNCINYRAVLTLEYCKIKRTCKVFTVAYNGIVFVCVTDNRAVTCDCAVSRTASNFGFTVTVIVVYHKLRIVCACTNVRSHIYTP